MKVTITEVAKLAGVAKSTVSRYLNGGYVSAALKQKIDQVIKETKYEPNAFARSLRAKQTGLIGVIIPRINSHSVSLTLKGIDDSLRQSGYQMLISNTNQKPEREIESFHSFANQNVDGIIWIATVVTEAHVKAIKEIDMPVLIVGQTDKNVASIVYDDKGAGQMMGEFVLKNGHRKIIFIGVSELDLAVGVHRKKGFMLATTKTEANPTYYETTFLMKDAYELMKEVDFKEHTSIVCATDNIALGVMKFLNEQGFRVPEDISVSGFGDYEIADMVGLTTVYFPYQEAGKRAGERILKLDRLETEYLNCQLKIRKTVDKV